MLAAATLLTTATAGGSEAGTRPAPVGAAALRRAAAVAARHAGPGIDRRAYQAAVEAYLWGYPLVTMARTRAQTLCLIPVNTLVNVPTLFGPSSRLVVTPNADTLYSSAWLDLRSGPVVLRVPEVRDRYYVFQFLDMYTNTIADVGTRTNGGRAGTYAIVGPGWRGQLPAGTARITSPTADVWVIGRTLVHSVPDLPAAVAQQRGYTLETLAGTVGTAATGPRSCPAGSPSAASFYRDLATTMAADPPPGRDAPVVSDLAAGGIGPGRVPSGAGTSDAALLEQAQGAARGLLNGLGVQAMTVHHGWGRLRGIGTYGTDYLARATVAAVGLGANVPAESVYYFARADQRGVPLSGRQSYIIHFGRGDVPPIDPRGFWSVTVYGPDHFLVANPINRYQIGDRTAGLHRGSDGSLDLYVSKTPPAGHETNWLPSPAGGFSLVLRAYLPVGAIRRASWSPPGINVR